MLRLADQGSLGEPLWNGSAPPFDPLVRYVDPIALSSDEPLPPAAPELFAPLPHPEPSFATELRATTAQPQTPLPPQDPRPAQPTFGLPHPNLQTVQATPPEPPSVLRPAPVERLPAPDRLSVMPPAEPSGSDDGLKPIGQISTEIALPQTPETAGGGPLTPPDLAPQRFHAQARFPREPSHFGLCDPGAEYGPALNFCYRPLYFEEVNLERYGYDWGLLQPGISALRFYGNAAVLPYRLTTQRSSFCTYHQHAYRPGGPAPRECRRPELRVDAATVQAAAVVGLIFLIP
jgi:hypothetical protein